MSEDPDEIDYQIFKALWDEFAESSVPITAGQVKPIARGIIERLKDAGYVIQKQEKGTDDA